MCWSASKKTWDAWRKCLPWQLNPYTWSQGGSRLSYMLHYVLPTLYTDMQDSKQTPEVLWCESCARMCCHYYDYSLFSDWNILYPSLSVHRSENSKYISDFQRGQTGGLCQRQISRNPEIPLLLLTKLYYYFFLFKKGWNFNGWNINLSKLLLLKTLKERQQSISRN